MKNPVLGVILAVVALILLSNTLFTVDMTEQAMVLQYGRHLRTITEPGLHAKIPFIQQVTIYEKRVLSS
ncbi:MAG: protease modulator HflC, partial [Dehalococcoidia bacterium]|nr:protease modulator HflC [Dehalococcoidia bacterium]